MSGDRHAWHSERQPYSTRVGTWSAQFALIDQHIVLTITKGDGRPTVLTLMPDTAEALADLLSTATTQLRLTSARQSSLELGVRSRWARE